MEIISDILQGSPEWFAARIGSIGGSSIGTVCSKGSGRDTLLYRLAGEILSGKKYEGFVSADMERGILSEPDARALYELTRDADVQQVGLIKHSEHKHCSPDGLVGTDGMIEIKSVIPSTHARTIIAGVVPSDYRRQIQWGLSIAEREWCDFISYCPDILSRPIFVVRAGMDETLIRDLHDGADKFIEEMLAIVAKVNG